MSPAVVPASECEPATFVKELFLTETPATQARGEQQLTATLAAERGAASAETAELAYEYGATDHVQATVALEAERENSTEQVASVSIGWLFLCQPGTPMLRVDAGVEHERTTRKNGGFASLSLGQRHALGGWVANVSHSSRDDETAYAAALLLETGVRPIAIEAMHERGEETRSNWVSASVYLFSADNFELGVAFADGSADASGKWQALLSVAGEF